MFIKSVKKAYMIFVIIMAWNFKGNVVFLGFVDVSVLVMKIEK